MISLLPKIAKKGINRITHMVSMMLMMKKDNYTKKVHL